MSDDRLKRIIAEKRLRKEREKAIDFEELCFPGQKEFVSDPAKRILACCSRRAGKSYGIAIKFLKTGFEFINSVMVYGAMSRSQGMEILWPAMQELNERLFLGLKFNRNSGDIEFPNGSKVLMRGFGSQREAEKCRGLSIRAACLDEAQGFPAWLLRITLEQILEPAMIQFGEDCWIAITGTPNAACAGGFYDAWSGVDEKGKQVDTWSTHHWTFFDNKAIPAPEKVVADVLENRGWNRDTPSFVREYLGQWVKDSEGSAFRINTDVNVIYTFDDQSAPDWTYALGVDLGIVDESAYVVGCYSPSMGEAVVVESFEESTDSPSESARHVLRLMEKYDLAEIVADTGGQGKAHVGEWARTYGIPVTPAQKHNKGGRVQLINADLMAGKLKFLGPLNHQLITEATIIQWDLDALEKHKYVWQRGYKDHLSDAFQYLFGALHHHHHSMKFDEREESEHEKWSRIADKMEEAASRRAVARQQQGSGLRAQRRAYYDGKL